MKTTRFNGFILLLLFCCTVYPQNFDSLKLALKQASHDTTRLSVLSTLAETLPDGEWEKYNVQMKALAEKHKGETGALQSLYQGYAATALSNMGIIYKRQGNIREALDAYHEALKLQQKLKDERGKAGTLLNIGVVYSDLSIDSLALRYYDKSMVIFEKLRDQYAIAQCLNSIGVIYDHTGEHEKAKVCYEKSMAIHEQLGDEYGIAQSLNNLGVLYFNTGDQEKAIESYRRAAALQKKIDDKFGLAISELHLSKIFFEKKQLKEAEEYAARSLSAASELHYAYNIGNAAEILYMIYKSRNDPARALRMHELFMLMRDSVSNEETRKVSIRKQFQYEYEKKEASVKAAAKAEKEKIELRAAENKKKQNIILYSVLAGLLLVSIFSAFIFRSLQQNKKANKIIALQKREVEHQKHAIEEKQREILDSIHYARRIQSALITSEKNMGKMIDRLAGRS